LPSQFLCAKSVDIAAFESFFDWVVSANGGVVSNVLLDGEERLEVGDLSVGFRDGLLVEEHLGAVGTGGAALTEGFGATHCW
jgi:hypothetical protein